MISDGAVSQNFLSGHVPVMFLNMAKANSVSYTHLFFADRLSFRNPAYIDAFSRLDPLRIVFESFEDELGTNGTFDAAFGNAKPWSQPQRCV